MNKLKNLCRNIEVLKWLNKPHIWWLLLGELSNNGVKNGLLEAYISLRTSKKVVIVLWKTKGAILYVQANNVFGHRYGKCSLWGG
jgi:hypothetical protein